MITEITNTRRRDVVMSQASQALDMSLIYRRANQHAKPPFEGVLQSWRQDHEIALNNKQGRALAAPLKRTTQRRTTKRLGHKASLCLGTHNQNRIHDGQDWPVLGHSLPTSQSGQDQHK